MAAFPALAPTGSNRYSSLGDKFVVGGTKQVASTVIKAPPLACCAEGDWLELLVPAAPMLLFVLRTTGWSDFRPGFVLVRTVLSDVHHPVAVAAFHWT